MDKLEAMDAYYKTHFDTSDLERVVRCKYCKHFQELDCPAIMAPFEKLMCGEDYCSRGERKE